MKKALITGSETFGKYITNPTKWLALSTDNKMIAGYEIHSLVFPSVVLNPEGVENKGETTIRKAKEIGVDVIVSFGMASEVKGFRLEKTGVNWVYNKKYLSDKENNRPLETSQPEKEKIEADLSFWDIEKMKGLFTDANLPFEANISDDAGQYSCNSWIYRTLLAMKKQKLDIPYIFMHCACTEEAIELVSDFDKSKILIKKENMIQVLEIILKSFKELRDEI